VARKKDGKPLVDMSQQSAERRIKDGFKFILYYAGILNALIRVVAIFRRLHPCVILTYHRIVEDRVTYLDKGPVMHHDLKQFERELVHLKRHFNVISMDELVRHMNSREGFRRPTVAVTFDDGYLDNYTLAYPLLQKYGVPATVYVTTGLVGTSDRTWPDQIEYALLATNQNCVEMPALFKGRKLAIRTREEKESACLQIGQALKLVPNDRRKQLLKDLFLLLGLNGVRTEAAKERLMLNWAEIREMAGSGITIGSHSHTHPILSRMPVDEAKQEISSSKELIEKHLGLPVKHFAFPNGGREDFTVELREYCRSLGIESIASLMHGNNDARYGNTLNLRRLGAMSPLWRFSWNLLKMFLGKHGKGAGGREVLEGVDIKDGVPYQGVK